MFTMPSSVRIFVATEPTDLRKSFDGLSAAVAHALGNDPLSGHLFVFFNKKRTQVRCLFWDRTGYCVLAKRLARGRFRFTEQLESGSRIVELESVELALILEGIELKGALRRARWRPSRTTKAA
jgi:transposase